MSTTKTVKTRKEHMCCCCYQKKPKGSTMTVVTIFPSSGIDMLDSPMSSYYCGCDKNINNPMSKEN